MASRELENRSLYRLPSTTLIREQSHLMPEIALTPLLIGRSSQIWFRLPAYTVVFLHGDYVSGEEFEQAEADVAVGALPALFAPFPNLGLLIVDEEHDDSYNKVMESVSRRDMAVVRGIMENVP